ncbi:MAG: response regulator transcription factor [Acidobacteriota bacterium]
MKILVIEDDTKICELLKLGLSEEKFVVDVATDGEAGEFIAATNHYDLIILDILLPKMDGLAVCCALRQAKNHTPILMLTARDKTTDKIAGLDSGADDYLTKPFVFDELLARVRALLRRGPVLEDAVLTYENVSIDRLGHTVKVHGEAVELTAREYGLLEYFIRHPGKVLTRQQLADHVWDASYDPFSNVVDVYINYLRKKIDTDPNFKLIHTLRGLGYMLKQKPRD